MDQPYKILCFSGKHVHVLDREEMVKVFGEKTVSEIDAGIRRHGVYAPACMECDKDDLDLAMDRELHELSMEMSAHDS